MDLSNKKQKKKKRIRRRLHVIIVGFSQVALGVLKENKKGKRNSEGTAL